MECLCYKGFTCSVCQSKPLEFQFESKQFGQFKTFAEIHEALKAGKQVLWSNTSYEVKREPYRKGLNTYNLVDGYVLDCRCISNYFGGLLHESEIGSCFVPTGIPLIADGVVKDVLNAIVSNAARDVKQTKTK